MEENPAVKAKYLVEELRKKTGLSRSTIYEHLSSFELKAKVHREKGKYYLPHQWTEHSGGSVVNIRSRPRMGFEITQRISGFTPGFKRQFPSVGFNIINLNGYPVKTRVEVNIILDGENTGLVPDAKGHYNGKALLGFEPFEGLKNGNFTLPERCMNQDKELTLEVKITVIDCDGREYKLLPKSWTYIRKENDWYFEPKLFTEK